MVTHQNIYTRDVNRSEFQQPSKGQRPSRSCVTKVKKIPALLYKSRKIEWNVLGQIRNFQGQGLPNEDEARHAYHTVWNIAISLLHYNSMSCIPQIG